MFAAWNVDTIKVAAAGIARSRMKFSGLLWVTQESGEISMQKLFSELRWIAQVARFWRRSRGNDFIKEGSEQAFHWSGAMRDGQTLTISGINGSVRAFGVGGREARLVAIKRGHRLDLKRVRVVVEQSPEGVKIRAIYPWHLQIARRKSVEVSFVVEIPADVRLAVRVTNGGIDVKSVAGGAELYTENGGVSISDAGWVSAEAVNGHIHASIRRTDWGRPLHFRTENGSIRVELPSSVSTRIHARTINGIVCANFPLAIERKKYNFLSGVLGADGQRELFCECANGSVHLSQAA
jgi:hypothetical protein